VIRLRPASPAARVDRVRRELRALGASFTSVGGYAAQVRAARKEWKKVLIKHSALFTHARDLLKSMDPAGLGGCMYCGRSEASEIEHFKPMNWYPAYIFDWLNYIYSCSSAIARRAPSSDSTIPRAGR